ncbi:MAG: sirohydrochlorin chelatase [Rubrivivax sp.]|jgi:sirohydrochlorin cobaltochelatase
MRGLILFAHGARDPRWAEPFQQVVSGIRQQAPELAMRLAFLELMEPSLSQAAAELAAEGCTEVTVQPLFLGTGGHLRRDLPLLMAELQAQLPGVAWTLQPAIGEHPEVIETLARCSLQGLQGLRTAAQRPEP